jgi:hypothetical protein
VTYAALGRFFFPLVLTQLALGFGGQFLNGGMARLPQAAQTLAVFGLAWGLTDFLVSPLSQVRQLGLVLAQGQAELRSLRRFVLLCCSVLMAALFALAESPLGDWVVGDLHGVSDSVALQVRWVLFAFIPLPLIAGINRLYSGVLIQFRRTDIVSVAMVAGMVVQIAAVLFLLPATWVQERPIALPVAAVYLGELVGLLIVLGGYAHCIHPFAGTGTGVGLDWAYVARFFWPLALVMAIQGLSRPLVNLFVSHQSDGVEALAALAVVYALAHLPYGWLNELRSIPAAFRNEGGQERILHFAVGCGLLSFSCMLLLFWTPLRSYILLDWIAVDRSLADRCVLPLMIFSFFPLAVSMRSYFNGMALVEHRTRALAPSAPARVGAILLALMTFSRLEWEGATMGVAALFCGFVIESLSVWFGVRIWPSWRKGN